MTRIEVDQSIKIGDTRAATVIALANDLERSILIPATAKRICIQTLRGRWKSKTVVYYRLFAAALFILLRGILGNVPHIIIDVEYPGHERDIKNDLLFFCRRARVHVDPGSIQFALVGKSSPAHRVAIETLRGRRSPDIVATAEKLLEVVA